MTQSALVAVDTSDPIAFYRQLTTCWENGDAVLPVDHRLSKAGARALVDRFRPAYFIDQRRVIGLADGAPVSPGIALVVATSGTTGEPKGVELTHANLAASAYATARWLGTGPGDRWCCCLPLAHIAGLSTLTRSIMADAEPEFTTFGVDEILRTRSTCISLVPTMLARLIEAKVDLTRFRVVLVGGGPTPRSLIEVAQRSGTRVVATYGMTETTGGCVYDGNALPGVEIEIGAHGVIRLHGPMVMSGYRLDEMLTQRSLQDGWFVTSDLGSIDSGKLTVLGRRDDLVITGGQKVAPAEVESTLMLHEAVIDAAVIGLPDEQWGEKVAAAVTCRSDVAPEELIEFVATRLARYKAPKVIVKVEQIPRNEVGKLMRDELRELIERGS